jgi:hypothetical protein
VVSNSWDTRRYVASARQADPQRRYRLLYEDEIRSVAGPDVARGGPEGTAPLLCLEQAPLVVRHPAR